MSVALVSSTPVAETWQKGKTKVCWEIKESFQRADLCCQRKHDTTYSVVNRGRFFGISFKHLCRTSTFRSSGSPSHFRVSSLQTQTRKFVWRERNVMSWFVPSLIHSFWTVRKTQATSENCKREHNPKRHHQVRPICGETTCSTSTLLSPTFHHNFCTAYKRNLLPRNTSCATNFEVSLGK